MTCFALYSPQDVVIVSGVMTPKGKVNLQRVLASLNTLCTECGYSIAPNEIMRIDFERMKCAKCGAVFVAKKTA